MPWCPSCRNEYDPGIPSCGDCGVALVEDRPAEAGTGPVFLYFLFTDPSLRERAVAALEIASVPYGKDEGPDGRPLLAVPADFGSTALERIDRASADLVVEPGEGFFLVRPFDAARDREIRDHPILREPWKSVAERREESLPALRDCIVRGSRSVRERARVLLRRFGSEALVPLAAAMREALAAADDVIAAELIQEFTKVSETGEWPGEVRALAALVGSGDPRKRRWGILLAGRLGLREAGPGLIALLGDPDAETALAADEALTEITGQDLGFDPAASGGELDRIREARRRSLEG